jgi:hypothetical protein
MAVTETQVRALLNFPRGLLKETVEEYITLRTEEVTKNARGQLFGVTSDNAVSATLIDQAIKMLCAADCLSVMVDTIPTYFPPKEQGPMEQRFRHQMKDFRDRADELMKTVSEKGGTAFFVGKTNTRQDSSSSTYNDSTLS